MNQYWKGTLSLTAWLGIRQIQTLGITSAKQTILHIVNILTYIMNTICVIGNNILHVNGLVENCVISISNTLWLPQSCAQHYCTSFNFDA